MVQTRTALKVGQGKRPSPRQGKDQGTLKNRNGIENKLVVDKGEGGGGRDGLGV